MYTCLLRYFLSNNVLLRNTLRYLCYLMCYGLSYYNTLYYYILLLYIAYYK